MTIDHLRKAALSKPFVPFTLSLGDGLGDGRRLRVTHPENIMVPVDASRIVIVESGEDYNIVDVLLITSIDFKKKAQRGKSNGAPNGRQRPS